MTHSRLNISRLSSRILQALTPEQNQLLLLVANEATRQGLSLYIVGGFVRDLLLGHPSQDFDMVIEGDAIQFAYSLANVHGGTVTSHNRFRTAKWFLSGSFPNRRLSSDTPHGRLSTLDLISARSETYQHPAVLPTVRLGSITDDLHRRDFTINTLALRLDGEHFGELLNRLGGLEDLEAGLIRVLHPGSFLDDPTRLIRAVRYEQRYGFQMTPETLLLIPDASPLVANLTAERLRHELDLILEEEKAASMLDRLAGLDLLRAVHPSLKWNHGIHSRFAKGIADANTLEQPPSRPTLGWNLWLMDIPVPDLQRLEKRLHFKSGLWNILKAASALLGIMNSLNGLKPSEWVAILDDIQFQAVQVVYLGLPAGASRQVLTDYLENWRYIKIRTTGHDLKKRGLAPGPVYQSILLGLRAAQLDGKIRTPTEELKLLEEMIKSGPHKP